MMACRVVVGISGGVDSSVAALLLKQQGFEVHGVFMKNWEDSFEAGYCGEDDLADAEEVCDTLGIPLHRVNFVAEYRQRVFEHFLAEYRLGRTPNPDILCNKEIKFRAFLAHALQLGAVWIATGHYARRLHVDGREHLLRGVDAGKDQSYFLHTLEQGQLARSLFPLGELSKAEVRRLAREADLVTHDKKDSTGICFIGERDFRTFLGQYLPARPGPMETPAGQVVGEHQGLMFYTLGQRQGLGIGGRAGDGGEPWYVAGKDLRRNVLVVVRGGQHPALFHRGLQAHGLQWINPPPTFPHRCVAKTRYRQADQGCVVQMLDNDRCEVLFDEPQRAITPGQSVVFYEADECLGGGVIDVCLD